MAHQKHKRGREKEKKNKRRKYRKRKIVIQSVFFFFLKERFTDTGGWTTLMPQRKMDFKSRASSHTFYLGSLLQKVAEIQET